MKTRPWTFPLPPKLRASLAEMPEKGFAHREVTLELPIGEDYDYIKDQFFKAVMQEQLENRRPLFIMMGVQWYFALRITVRNEADRLERQPNQLGRAELSRERFVYGGFEVVLDRTCLWGVRVICEDRDEVSRCLEEEWKAKQ